MKINRTSKLITISTILVLSIATLQAGIASAKPIEIRGTPGSVEAGSDMNLDGFNFPVFQYSIKGNTTSEYLNLHFTGDGTIEEDDAVYTTNTYKKSMRFIKFMGGKYHSLDPDKANLLSKVLICFDEYDAPNEGNTKKTLVDNERWNLKEGYSLVASDVDIEGNQVYLILYKEDKIVYEDIVESGDYFMYNKTIESVDDITLFTSLVERVFHGIDSNVVVLKMVRQYSDTPKKIEVGQEYGNFEVKEITNKLVKLTNINTISFSLLERDELLGDWIKFRVSENGWWGYAYTETECAVPASNEPTIISESPPIETLATNSTPISTTITTTTDMKDIIVDTSEDLNFSLPEEISVIKDKPAQEYEIRIADKTGDWGHPSPYLAYGRGAGYVRMHFIFDTLVWKNETSDLIPLLAENWEYIPEEDTYIFNLVKNAKWHDGEPVTANDVAFTIEYMKQNPYGWVVLDSVDRAEAVNEHTVKIIMSGPYAPFMEDIGGTMPILPEHIWKDIENPISYVEPDAFIGCGPFKYVDFSKEHGTYHYEAFNEYHHGKPNIDRLIYVKTGDPQMALQRGEADFASIKPEMAETLTEEGFVVIEGPHYWNKKLMINHNQEPLDNIVFRQALAYAIDQDEFVDKSLRGYGKPASYGLISSESKWGNPDVLDYSYDPDKAKEMISSLGYELKDGIFFKDNEPLAFEVLVSMVGTGGQSTPDRDGEILKNQLEKVGIQTDLTSLETKIVDQKVINWDFDLAISGHGGIGGDPKILYEKVIQVPGSKASPNTARYDKSEELNSLLDDLMHEMDPVKRQEAVYEAQNVYARELPAISLYYPTWYYAYNPDAGIDWFYTTGGIAKGIPIPQNKVAMIGSHAQEDGENVQTVAAMQTTDNTQDTPMMPLLAVFAILAAFYVKRIRRNQ